MFKVDTQQQEGEDDADDLRLGGDKLLLTCVGVGYTNINKAIK
jgi:hypothetical protein